MSTEKKIRTKRLTVTDPGKKAIEVKIQEKNALEKISKKGPLKKTKACIKCPTEKKKVQGKEATEKIERSSEKDHKEKRLA